ncbi:tetratricopeptide repeat protein [Blastopirellula marina]|uniref:Uncharacterized protein n=1 Tax=Blastopirellula marina TaxID=124 RepID=A0A2S8GCN4_9BACT|nr:tetratricopeptide repeat protein [Blastopirellula marina]PQO42060.1 hypothetical protein C5Y93_27300 [Blastopirellula marina]
MRPLAQLAAHLTISDSKERPSVVTNPHLPPKRFPPVAPKPVDAPPSPLETIRFPLKIQQSPLPEKSPQPASNVSQLHLPEPPAFRPHDEIPAADIPMELNPPELAPPTADAPEFSAVAPPKPALAPAQSQPNKELPPPNEQKQIIEPNYLRDLPPSGRFTQNDSPDSTLPSNQPAANQLGPPASLVSLKPHAASQEKPQQRLDPPRFELNLPEISVPAKRNAPPVDLSPPAPKQAEIDHALIAVRQRMNSLVDHGLVMAQRGAHFSARAEFIQALRLATQTLDTAQRSHRHSEALAEAVAALEEAGDFIPSGAQLEANINLELIVSSQRTPVLKEADLSQETTLTATQQYFAYAQERLIAACDNLPECSRALVGLARIQEHLYTTTGDNRTLIGPRAIALFQTALAVDGNNFEAANELGVLLARYGQFEDAKQALLQGVQAAPRPQLWQNLASVHERLGEMEMARRAQEEANLAEQHARYTNGLEAVRWVSPEELAQHGQADAGFLQTAAPAGQSPYGRAPLAQRRATPATR